MGERGVVCRGEEWMRIVIVCRMRSPSFECSVEDFLVAIGAMAAENGFGSWAFADRASCSGEFEFDLHVPIPGRHRADGFVSSISRGW